jgi:hypothetical protein
MTSGSHSIPRALIVAGLALVGVGAALSAGFVVYNSGWPPNTILQAQLTTMLLMPLFYVAFALAFWWVTQLNAADSEQQRVLRNGFLVFGVAGVLGAAISGAFVAEYSLFLNAVPPVVPWLLVQYSVELAGFLVASSGFIALSHQFSARRALPVGDQLAATPSD